MEKIGETNLKVNKNLKKINGKDFLVIQRP